MSKYVIIGGGIAGIHCIEGIRSVDREGTITLVSAEETSNYGRPLISYYLEGKTDLPHISYQGQDFYERNAVTALHGVTAVKINPKEKKVLLSDDSSLPYDKLCVCAGSSPFVPPFEGLDTVEKKFSFMTLADAQSLERAVSPDSRALIVGGGLIGLKCAEGLKARVASVTVCDLAAHVLSSILEPESAAMVEKHLESQGIRLLLGDSAARFESHTAHMKSGEIVTFDTLVLAIGVRPNVSLLKEAGGETGRGIVTDDHMATSLSDIYAAGDCVESQNTVTGQRGVLAILPNAATQGHAAGVNMAGGQETFTGGIPMNSMGLFGLHLMTAGSYEGESFEEKGPGRYKKLFVKDGHMVGFILIGDVRRAGIYTALIREKRPLSSLDFDAVKREPSLLPFGTAYRMEKLGVPV